MSTQANGDEDVETHEDANTERETAGTKKETVDGEAGKHEAQTRRQAKQEPKSERGKEGREECT